jgi:glycosyltransferase involved in cell wall biosynthesis
VDINLISPINQLGYGVASLNILKTLIRKNHKVALWVIGNGDVHSNDFITVQEAQLQTKWYNTKAPSVRIWHQHDLAMHVGKGLHVGFPIFELDKFTPEEIHQLNSVDILFVASQWASEVITSNNITTKVHVVPLGVDREIFSEHTCHVDRGHTTVFMNIGKWEKRKGHDILAQVFNLAFNDKDDVQLIMHCNNPFLSPAKQKEWELLYTKSKLGKAGKILISSNRFASQYELARYMQKADCGVFPSRAEGWNLELLEFMSMGKAVIATDYSAHTEYASSHNCCMIDIDKLEPAEDGIWFHKQGQWAAWGKSQTNQLVEYLRNIHQLKQAGMLPVDIGGIHTAKRFTWDNTIKCMEEYLC